MRKQKILAALLALVMVVTLLPLTALAVGGSVSDNDGVTLQTTYYLYFNGSTYAGTTTPTAVAIFKFKNPVTPTTASHDAAACTDDSFDSEHFYFICPATSGSQKLLAAYQNNGTPGVGTRNVNPQSYTDTLYTDTILTITPTEEGTNDYIIKGSQRSLYFHVDGSTIKTKTDTNGATFHIEKAPSSGTGMYYITWTAEEFIARPGPAPVIPQDVKNVQPHESTWTEKTGLKTEPTSEQPFPSNDDSVLAVGQDSWRIPDLITLEHQSNEKNNGRLLAVADANWNEELDSGNIDTVLAISDDNGATWSHQFVNYFDDSADKVNYYATAFMDAAIVEGLDGTIYLIEDLWPGSVAISGLSINHPDANTNGYQLVDDEERLVLYDSPDPANQDDNNWKYYIGDFNEATGYAPVYWRYDSTHPYYWVDHWYYLYNYDYTPLYTQQLKASTRIGETYKAAASHTNVDKIYEDGTIQANIFFYSDAFENESGTLSSESASLIKLHARACLYLWLRTSNDGGETWSNPEILNPKVFQKNECGNFLGVGPGRGEVIDSGANKGRVVFPLYESNGGEHTRVIYKDPDGEWQSSVKVTSNSSSEAAPVDVNGVLYLFTRYGGYYVSTNGGATWSTRYSEPTDKLGDCQRTAILYSKRIDGKPAILLAGPSTDGNNTTDRNARSHGKIWVGLVDEDSDRITWENEYKMDVTGGASDGTRSEMYGYSCLTEMEDGRIALLWEDYYSAGHPTVIGTMRLDIFDIDDIAPNAVLEPTLEDLPKQLVTVKCDNGFCKGVETTYGAEAEGVSITWDGSNTATATIDVNYYVQQFSEGQDVHNLVPESASTITLNLTYADGKWTVTEAAPVTINVHCEAMPDAPSKDDAATIIAEITVTDANGTHDEKTYEVTADDISDITVVNKSEDTYTVDVTISADSFVEQYKGENGEHTLNSEAELKVTLVYDMDDDGWALKEEADLQITVACNPSTQPEQPNPPIVTPPATGGTTDVPEDQIPLNPTPDDDGDTDVDEGDTPLAPAPEDKGDTDISDTDTPLDSTPKTGDTSIAIAVLWSIFSMSAVGFVSVMLSMKKSGKHSK